MIEGAFALAFTAGLVSTLDPCWFAMLPAYMSYFMGLDAEQPVDRTAAVRQGLVVGEWCPRASCWCSQSSASPSPSGSGR